MRLFFQLAVAIVTLLKLNYPTGFNHSLRGGIQLPEPEFRPVPGFAALLDSESDNRDCPVQIITSVVLKSKTRTFRNE